MSMLGCFDLIWLDRELVILVRFCVVHVSHVYVGRRNVLLHSIPPGVGNGIPPAERARDAASVGQLVSLVIPLSSENHPAIPTDKGTTMWLSGELRGNGRGRMSSCGRLIRRCN